MYDKFKVFYKNALKKMIKKTRQTSFPGLKKLKKNYIFILSFIMLFFIGIFFIFPSIITQ